ncbi:MAG: hypothetical protein JWN93_2317 [Hyphomicrobiales bacterium]|nr:hypothetical protein [Hyphomicrobiales bacterium]
MARHKRDDNHVDRAGMLEALGVCRSKITREMATMKAMGPRYGVASGALAAIDALATMLTGQPYYFHDKGTTGRPSEPFKDGPESSG